MNVSKMFLECIFGDLSQLEVSQESPHFLLCI